MIESLSVASHSDAVALLDLNLFENAYETTWKSNLCKDTRVKQFKIYYT